MYHFFRKYKNIAKLGKEWGRGRGKEFYFVHPMKGWEFGSSIRHSQILCLIRGHKLTGNKQKP